MDESIEDMKNKICGNEKLIHDTASRMETRMNTLEKEMNRSKHLRMKMKGLKNRQFDQMRIRRTEMK